MKKIMTVVLVLALITAIRPVRERVGAAAIPLLEKLGPAGAGLLNPARNMGAKAQTAEIARLLMNERQEGRPMPTQRGFQEWLMRRSGDRDLLTDPWGEPYWLAIERNVVTVGSSGADRTRNTADDVTRQLD